MSMWDCIDCVKVINLDHREDRWSDFLKVWEGIIPDSKLERISAVLGIEIIGYLEAPWFQARTGERATAWAGVAGCTLSHRRVMESIVKSGTTGWTLILEDDVEYHHINGLPSLVEEMLSSGLPSGLFYLGCQKLPPFARKILGGEHGIWEISGALTTHAYLVHAETAKKLLDYLPVEDTIWEWVARYRAIDTWYYDYFHSVTGLPIWACLPNLITQVSSLSDISNQVVDHTIIRSVLSEPRPINSFSGMIWSISQRLKRIKIYFNSMRTYHRALAGGFPGYRKKRS